MFDAITAVLSIFLLIGTGMLLTRLRWIDEAGAKLLSRITVNVGLFALVINNMLMEFTRDRLIESAGGMLICYIAQIAAAAVAVPLARLAKVPQNRRGAFACMFVFSNSIFIGMPVAVSIFGQSATPYALIYYVTNTSTFWSIGNYMMGRDGGQGGKLDIKNLLPMPLIAFLLSIALVLLDIKLPAVIMKTTGYLGGMVTPISLIYTGYVITCMLERGALKWHRGYALIMAGRFLIVPAMVVGLSFLIPVGSQVAQVLTVQAAMPVMTQTTILAGSRGADVEYTAGGLLFSTILSLVVIPLIMAVLPYIF